jgi:hypothetical protein
MEWTHLTKCERHRGFQTKLNIRVGCEGYITPDDPHFCLFRKIGYELDGTSLSPCGNQYHLECIKVEIPLKTRLVRATLGLQYPPPPILDSFSLHLRGMYHQGRPRMGTYLDIRRYPAINAHIDAPHRYGERLGFFDVAGDGDFGQKYGIDLFPKAPITQPPRSAVIPLLWGVLEYTLQTSQKTGEGIKYNTARSLQSAASFCHLWEEMLQFPGHMYRDRENNAFGASHFSPADSVIATLGSKCMMRGLGTESRPPVALRYSHVGFNQDFRGRQYDGCGDDWLSKYEYAAPTFAETCAMGGWLRVAETFSLDDEDVEIITPSNGWGTPHFSYWSGGRPFDLLTLGPETKGQSPKRVDVTLADTFASGISPHYWYLKLMECKEKLGWIGGPLFRHYNGQRWTSSYFKSTHVHPLLHI